MTSVLLGLHSMRKQRSCQNLKVTQTIPYPAYNQPKRANDIMLLRVRWRSLRTRPVHQQHHTNILFLGSLFQLETAAKQTSTVKYLHLGSPGREPKAGTTCMVAGWGQTEKNKPSDVLRSANVTVVDRKKCSKDYGSKAVITKEMICAGSDKVDTCQVRRVQTGERAVPPAPAVSTHGRFCSLQGDSGGPILCKGALVGVTSFGLKCGAAPGVYTYITKKHVSWIKKNIGASEMEE